ncbi:MAG: hypothetical protein IPG34_02685 [Rhodocyclaceae bacterium]|nr:hypothetical protein [Rhodocyclaceae bacterium]
MRCLGQGDTRVLRRTSVEASCASLRSTSRVSRPKALPAGAGQPWTATNTEKLYDITGRIKQGYYPGADYVLWGNINNVEFRQDVNPIQGTNGTVSSTLARFELVGEFSLINTRTYEVKAAFTAKGEGSDTKLLTGMGGRVTNNRSRVMMDVSRSSWARRYSEVEGQFAEGAGASSRQRSVEVETTIKEEKVICHQ